MVRGAVGALPQTRTVITNLTGAPGDWLRFPNFVHAHLPSTDRTFADSGFLMLIHAKELGRVDDSQPLICGAWSSDARLPFRASAHAMTLFQVHWFRFQRLMPAFVASKGP